MRISGLLLLLLLAPQDDDPEQDPAPERHLLLWKFEKGQEWKFSVKKTRIEQDYDAKKKKWGKPRVEWTVDVDFEFVVEEVTKTEIRGTGRVRKFAAKGKGLPDMEKKLTKSLAKFLRKTTKARLTLRKSMDACEYGRLWLDVTKDEGFYDIATYLGSKVPDETDGIFIRPPIRQWAPGEKWGNDEWVFEKIKNEKTACLVRTVSRKPHPAMPDGLVLDLKVEAECDLKNEHPVKVTMSQVKIRVEDRKETAREETGYTLTVRR